MLRSLADIICVSICMAGGACRADPDEGWRDIELGLQISIVRVPARPAIREAFETVAGEDKTASLSEIERSGFFNWNKGYWRIAETSTPIGAQIVTFIDWVKDKPGLPVLVWTRESSTRDKSITCTSARGRWISDSTLEIEARPPDRRTAEEFARSTPDRPPLAIGQLGSKFCVLATRDPSVLAADTIRLRFECDAEHPKENLLLALGWAR